MKSKFLKLVTILLSTSILSIGCTANNSKPDNSGDELTIVTSFYPIYISTLNIVKDIPDVNLINLTQPQTGCLHGYQLTPSDLKTLSKADAFVINGLGMEEFLDDVISQYDNMEIVEASEGISLIESDHSHSHDHEHEADDTHDHEECTDENCDHDHEHKADDTHNHEECTDENCDHDHEHEADDTHNHEECTDKGCNHNHDTNPHVWVSISKNIEQVENIAEELSEIDPDNADAYKANAENYIAKLQSLKEEMHSSLEDISHRDIITFHEAFPYFAEEFDLNIAGILALEPDVEPSAKDLEKIIETTKNMNIPALFIEPQYSPKAAETIARETGAKIFTLDPVVTGESNEDAADDYINKMKENLNVLKEALK